MAVSESVLGLYDIVLCYDLTNLEIRHIFWQRGQDRWLSLCWAKWKRTKEDWSLYVERMEHFFLANGITEADKKRAVFLSVVGLSAYRIIRNLFAPKKPGEKSYVELIAALSAHFKPTPSEIVERCRFHSRSRFCSYFCGRASQFVRVLQLRGYAQQYDTRSTGMQHQR